MCMTCGCGRPEDRHGSPDNITEIDLLRAADASHISLDEVVSNLTRTMELVGAKPLRVASYASPNRFR